MRIAVPREIKVGESRVAMTPSGVRELRSEGHEVAVQSGAGNGIGLSDDNYRAAGAEIQHEAEALFEKAELIVKVKEPQPEECRRLRPEQTIFTYLHLASDLAQADALIASKATAIAYETVIAPDGSLPLLVPMSEVAGRMSVQVGAHLLERASGGAGVLLGGVPGTPPARVLIVGGGVAGSNAAEIAVGMGADVAIVDRSLPRLRELAARFDGRIRTAFSTEDAIARLVAESDLVVGTVLVPGDAAPRLVTREMVRSMRDGGVIVDVAIDQGGCVETSRPTTHVEPTFVDEGVVHYCVTNMPGAVARTATQALCNATLPYVRALAGAGIEEALRLDDGLAAGLNVRAGEIVHTTVAAGIAATRAQTPTA